jgi:16S rRNA (guanine(1405)-N(7))-methyltransferase
MPDDAPLKDLVAAVQANRKYAQITPALVRRLSADTLAKGLIGKSAVKSVRNKLHQVGGAYFRSHPDYEEALTQLGKLDNAPDSPALRQFCRDQMAAHASTAERLPILPEFFQTCLAPIAPLTSVLDLACGLNPLAAPWMPLDADCTYTACDIYQDMLVFIEEFSRHIGLHVRVKPCDLVGEVPNQTAQVAFLLKAIPCLEQIDKDIGLPLLQKINAQHILVSFPARSLGGRKKGMPVFYRDHFYDMVDGQGWQVREYTFPSEIAFLVTK